VITLNPKLPSSWKVSPSATLVAPSILSAISAIAEASVPEISKTNTADTAINPTHQHDWWVYSVSFPPFAPKAHINVQCRECRMLGSVPVFTRHEWLKARHHRGSYRWQNDRVDEGRVIVNHICPFPKKLFLLRLLRYGRLKFVRFRKWL